MWNDGQKMDEGVKISKSNIWPIMMEMVDLHIKSALRNSDIYRFHYIGSWSFPLYEYKSWTKLYKTRKILLINLKRV